MEAAAGAVGLFLLTLHHPRESPRGHQQQWSHNWAQAHHLLSHCLFSSRAPPAQGQQQLQQMLATQRRYHRIFHLPIQLQQRLQLFLQQQVINSTTVLNMGRCVNSEISKSFRYVAKNIFPQKFWVSCSSSPLSWHWQLRRSLCAWLQECCRQVVSNSMNKFHQTIHAQILFLGSVHTKNIRLPRPSSL